MFGNWWTPSILLMKNSVFGLSIDMANCFLSSKQKVDLYLKNYSITSIKSILTSLATTYVTLTTQLTLVTLTTWTRPQIMEATQLWGSGHIWLLQLLVILCSMFLVEILCRLVWAQMWVKPTKEWSSQGVDALTDTNLISKFFNFCSNSVKVIFC